MNIQTTITLAETTIGLTAAMTCGLRSAKREELHLDANEDLTLSDYAIIVSKFSKTHGVSRKAMKCFFLPRIEVRQGDKVTVHTGSGKYELQEIPDVLRVHHIYLGERKPLYRSCRRALTVARMAERRAYSPLGRDWLP